MRVIITKKASKNKSAVPNNKLIDSLVVGAFVEDGEEVLGVSVCGSSVNDSVVLVGK